MTSPMRARAVHAVALNALLALISVFYLLSPTVYAFFSEMTMSYSYVPAWFARTAPARVTAAIFDRYNATAPRTAHFRAAASCYMVDEGAKREPGCIHELTPGARVYGPPLLRMASGFYIARFEFADRPGCAVGEARVEVATAGRFGKVLADYTAHIRPGTNIELPFRLKTIDAALGPLEFRAIGETDCVVLSRVGWTVAPPDVVVASQRH